DLLSKLIGHPRVSLGRSQPVQVESAPGRLSIGAKLSPTGEIDLVLGRDRERSVILPAQPCWLFCDRVFRPVRLPATCQELLRGPIRLHRAQVPVFLSRDWPELVHANDLKANFQIEDFTLEPQAPRFLLALTGGLAQLQAQLQCAYGPRIMTLGVTS